MMDVHPCGHPFRFLDLFVNIRAPLKLKVMMDTPQDITPLLISWDRNCSLGGLMVWRSLALIPHWRCQKLSQLYTLRVLLE